MVRVTLGSTRDQTRSYGFYKQASPTGDLIVVRRKVGEPQDYQHDSSRAVKRQREALGQASKLYSGLLHIQKQQLKHQAEEVEYIRGHGKSDIKLLQGRALFISKATRSLTTRAKLPEIYNAVCIVATDINRRIIDLAFMARSGTGYPNFYSERSYLGDGQTIIYPIKPEYAYYWLSYTPMIWITAQNGFLTYSELIKLHQQHTYPPADYRGVRTYTNAFFGDMIDWFCQQPTDPAIVWDYLIHEWTTGRPKRVKPDPATRLTWRTHTLTRLKLTIDLLDVTVPTTIFHGYKYNWCIVWEITIDGEGHAHLDPPQHTAIVSLEHWEVLGYE